MKRIVPVLLTLALIAGLLLSRLARPDFGDSPLSLLKARYAKKHLPSADHTRFDVLRKRFTKPQDVTAACISCHNERHLEVMRSSHWNWERTEYIEGKGIRTVGKRNILNNFCIGISGNEQSCNKCHIGYGYADKGFEFNNPLNIDCLACHDNSSTYLKAAMGAGMPDTSVDLSYVAQHVGRPTRTTCGTCHFFGGGGNNVKHGDLEKALFNPSRDLDVHMAYDGENMQCVDCHTAENHQMLGKMYSVSSMNHNRVRCEQCHTNLPHADDLLNKHTYKVACQTCHIPSYAKANPTKLFWDWSTAGRLENGKPIEVKDSTGVDTYLSIKGSFVWGRRLTPEYLWFNGTASHYLIGDPIDTSSPIKLNTLFGDYDDPDAKITPVKIHRANQIFDRRYLTLIQPKTVSTKDGDGGYWKEFNWQRASEEGMKAVGLPFSGSYGFTRTEMTWPINHMVSPAKNAVQCEQCHTRDTGRLSGLTGFYIPGRDRNPGVELFGTAAILVTCAAISLHGGIRIAVRLRKGAAK